MQVIRSDRQLIRYTIKKLPWFSIFILIIACCIFILSGLADERSTLFSLQTGDSSGFLGWAFDLRRPFQNFAFNTLSSFFIHADSEHLLTNLLFSVLVLIPLELRFGRLFVGFTLVLGHLSGLLGAAVAYHFLSQPPWVAGMSGGLLAGMVSLFFARGQIFAFTMISILSVGWMIFSWNSFVCHSLSLLAGCLLSIRQFKSRSSTKQF